MKHLIKRKYWPQYKEALHSHLIATNEGFFAAIDARLGMAPTVNAYTAIPQVGTMSGMWRPHRDTTSVLLCTLRDFAVGGYDTTLVHVFNSGDIIWLRDGCGDSFGFGILN